MQIASIGIDLGYAQKTKTFKWAIKHQLARGIRPGMINARSETLNCSEMPTAPKK